MKKVLIHIGTGKTGSSSIQKTLRESGKKLNRLGIRYPRYSHPTNHEELNVVFKSGAGPRGIKGRFVKQGESLDEYRSRLHDQLVSELAVDKSAIYSAEHLYALRSNGIEKLAHMLDEYSVDDVKVLLYFREPVSYYASQVQQKLRGSSKILDPNKYQPDYCGILARWKAVFDDVEVREFDRSALVDGDVVDDFLAVCSEYFHSEKLKKLPKAEPANETLPLEMMVMLQAFREYNFSDKENTLTPATGRLIKKMQALDFPYTKPSLKDEVVDVLITNNQASVRKLRKMVGYKIFDGFPEGPQEQTAEKLDITNVSEVFESPDELHYQVAALSSRLISELVI